MQPITDLENAITRLDDDHPQVILWFADLVRHMENMDVLIQEYAWENYDGNDDMNVTSAILTVPNGDGTTWDYLVGYDSKRSVAMLTAMDEDGDFDDRRMPKEKFNAEREAYYRQWWSTRNPHIGKKYTPPEPPPPPPAYASEDDV